jgi:Bacterial regulatory proteins, tetR family
MTMVPFRKTERRRKRQPLDQAQVVRAALALLDEVGLDELTMRRLAERLGVKFAADEARFAAYASGPGSSRRKILAEARRQFKSLPEKEPNHRRACRSSDGRCSRRIVSIRHRHVPARRSIPPETGLLIQGRVWIPPSPASCAATEPRPCRRVRQRARQHDPCAAGDRGRRSRAMGQRFESLWFFGRQNQRGLRACRSHASLVEQYERAALFVSSSTGTGH